MKDHNSDKKLFIINKRPSKIGFPYYDKNGKHEGTLELMPGNNPDVDVSIWEKVKLANKEDFENYYDSIIKVKKINNSKKIDYSVFSLDELVDCIEHSTDEKELFEIKQYENSREKSRKTILKAIENQQKKMKRIDERINK